MFIPEPEAKRVFTLAKYASGDFRDFYTGLPLHMLVSDSLCEVAVFTSGVVDEDYLAFLEATGSEEIIKEASKIYIEVRPKKTPAAPLSKLLIEKGAPTNAWFVAVSAETSIRLQVAINRSSSLYGCKVSLESVGMEAESLNHAYSIISELFEPHRISHTGNVFEKCYLSYTNENQVSHYRKLRHFREAIEHRFLLNEQRRFLSKKTRKHLLGFNMPPEKTREFLRGVAFLLEDQSDAASKHSEQEIISDRIGEFLANLKVKDTEELLCFDEVEKKTIRSRIKEIEAGWKIAKDSNTGS
ncbi:MAG: hypothetical protein J5I65_03210 [Aridibacter famidurans]|nr:hypothetical protein [Aridibacter famidurans]